MTNRIQNYEWGSVSALSTLQHRAQSAVPEAELWMGAHPAAPSTIAGVSLETAIEKDPVFALGNSVVQAFGPKLPFLLKVLAAEQPLSLQAHPNTTQAREGFERENAAGVPLKAANRSYKDANHKPELIVALTPFEALCGFRDPRHTAELFSLISTPANESLLKPLINARSDAGLKAFFTQLMTTERSLLKSAVDATVERCGAVTSAAFRDERALALKLARQYPGDPGIIGALSLNFIRLKPLEALFLPAGKLHSYVGGTGIELMAASDNVLRGGLTPKFIDVAELIKTIRFEASEERVLRAHGETNEKVFDSECAEFQLSRIELTAGTPATVLARRGPDILLCTSGAATAVTTEAVELTQGQSAFAACGEGPITLSGTGTLWRATVRA